MRVFTHLPTYYDEFGNVIQFLKIADNSVPGFSYRVTLNHHKIGYLSSDKKPSSIAAEFFMKEHGHKCSLVYTGKLSTNQGWEIKR